MHARPARGRRPLCRPADRREKNRRRLSLPTLRADSLSRAVRTPNQAGRVVFALYAAVTWCAPSEVVFTENSEDRVSSVRERPMPEQDEAPRPPFAYAYVKRSGMQGNPRYVVLKITPNHIIPIGHIFTTHPLARNPDPEAWQIVEQDRTFDSMNEAAAEL